MEFERPERHVFRITPVEPPDERAGRRVGVDALLSYGQDDEHGRRSQTPHEDVEQFDRRRARPVDVLEHREQRTLHGDLLERRRDGIEQAVTLPLAIDQRFGPCDSCGIAHLG